MAARAVSSTAILVLVAAIFVGGAAAQSTSGCTQTLISLSPCLNYITGNETVPSKQCCSQLETVVQSQPQCLCAALNADPAALGLNINKTRALELPAQCNVKTPPVSDCKSAAAPTSPSSGTPAGQTPTSAGTGSKATPTTDIGNGGESLRGSAGLVAGFIAAVVYAISAA